MTLQVATSSLTLEEFLQNEPQFHWSHPNGSKGPIVGIDYGLVPVQLGNSRSDVLGFSDKSLVLEIQLITADGRRDRAAAKIMKAAPNVVRLKNELNILRGLRHKHIVAVLGSFSSPTRKEKLEYGILVFPLAAQNLQDFLEEISEYNEHHEEHSLTWSAHDGAYKLLPYFSCLCTTVLFLHEQVIKHRDIKPANILIDKADNVILADFDISKVYNDDKGAITYGSLDGTVMYSSKDVWKDSAKGNPSSERGLEWDVVSLGFVFLEMATVLFGKNLKEMRAPMAKPEGSERVIYSEALAEGKIKDWLVVLRDAATANIWKVPRQFAHLTEVRPDYLEQFLGAIEDMMSAEQNNDQPLKRAWKIFGCLSTHCPGPQSDS